MSDNLSKSSETPDSKEEVVRSLMKTREAMDALGAIINDYPLDDDIYLALKILNDNYRKCFDDFQRVVLRS